MTKEEIFFNRYSLHNAIKQNKLRKFVKLLNKNNNKLSLSNLFLILSDYRTDFLKTIINRQTVVYYPTTEQSYPLQNYFDDMLKFSKEFNDKSMFYCLQNLIRLEKLKLLDKTAE
jgi:hypothetical protein